MKRFSVTGFLLIALSALNCASGQLLNSPNTALTNGKWFNGKSFDTLTVYSVNGQFTFKRPARIDTSIDLAGTWLIPPFAEAHNHNIGTGITEMDKKAIGNYLNTGVFYVKIMGNLPLPEEKKRSYGLNQPAGLDVAFAQGNITGSGGHPIRLVETLLSRGLYPGYTKETLKDFRYFTIDSETELKKKWPMILKLKPDFIKIIVCQSDEFEKLKNDTTVWYRGLDPKLIAPVVALAHQQHLKVSAHIVNPADFHNVLVGGVDEIAHIPRMISGVSHKQISVGDAQLAAKRKVPVITTLAISLYQGGSIKPEDFSLAKKYQAADLKILHDNGVSIAIGTDNPADNSTKEVFYIKDLGVFDNVTLLNMWTGTTPRIIFPERKIGAIQEGYEASFLALGGNPVVDLNNITDIRLRFKQGFVLGP